MKSFTIRILAAAGLALALSACGGKESSGDGAPKPNPDTNAPDTSPVVDEKAIADGKYFLTAVSVEGFNSAGESIPKQALQVSGDYFWTTKHLEGAKYEFVMSGAAKISNSNELLVEINCKGAQDTYTFDWTESGALRNVRQTESGCPQGLDENESDQKSLERLSATSFVYTVAYQADGARYIDTYTFRK